MHLEGLYRYARSGSTGVGLGPHVTLEATTDVLDANHLWNTRLSWVVNTRTLVEARTGGYTRHRSTDPRPPNDRLGPPGFLDESLGQIVSVNAIFFEDSDRARADATVSLTRFAEIGGQAQDLKAGLEFETTASTERRGSPGGMFFVSSPSVRFRVVSLWDGETDEATSRRGAAYVRDRWAVHDRVTFDLGIRLDVNHASVPERGTIFSTNPVSARAGVAWAVTADHATVVRAHYGRYHDSILTRQISDLDASNQSPQIVGVLLPAGLVLRDGQVVGPDGQVFELFRRPAEPENTTIDADIRHSYVDQFVVGIEREVVPDVSVQVQYIRRNFEQFMGVINTNTDWTPQQVRDPGPDGILGTGDDGPLFTIFRPSNASSDRRFLYTNPAGAFRRYDAMQVIVTKRYARNWQMQASYTWSRSEATVGNLERTNAGLKDLGETAGTLSPGVFSSPNGAINAEGTAPLAVSELKVLGTYRVPVWGGFNVSGIYRYHSGLTWERQFYPERQSVTDDDFTIRAEPRGTRRLPAIASLDLRTEKTWRGFGGSGMIGAFVDVFNLTNEGTAVFVNGFLVRPSASPLRGPIRARSAPGFGIRSSRRKPVATGRAQS